jgi:hypothetical protein
MHVHVRPFAAVAMHYHLLISLSPCSASQQAVHGLFGTSRARTISYCPRGAPGLGATPRSMTVESDRLIITYILLPKPPPLRISLETAIVHDCL